MVPDGGRFKLNIEKSSDEIKQKKNLPNNQSTFLLYTGKDGKVNVHVVVKDESIWLTQKAMDELFGKERSVITKHLKNIFSSGELEAKGNVQKMHVGHSDKPVKFYNLDTIISLGYRVNSYQATQFRIWATKTLKDYITKGFVMDDERLKNPDGRPDYFDELLERIRDIRASEKRFYQKVRDLFALSSDYDSTDKATQMFFAQTQNKLLYAVTKKTAAELIVSRADANKSNMALTAWKGRVVRKQDIYIAKNYLNEDEIDTLNRLVVVFLESAELRAKNKEDIDMKFWQENVDKIIEFQDREVLRKVGDISKKQMVARVKDVYGEFDGKRKKYDALQADNQDLQELKVLEDKVKKEKMID